MNNKKTQQRISQCTALHNTREGIGEQDVTRTFTPDGKVHDTGDSTFIRLSQVAKKKRTRPKPKGG